MLRARALGLAAAIALLAAGVAATAAEFLADEELEISGSHEDMVFAAGQRVSISATSPDEMLAAGRSITLNNAQAQRFTLAGDTLLFTDFEADDVAAAGRQLEFIEGDIADDVMAAGGWLSLGEALRVGGSAFLSGAEVIVEAPIGGELRAAGERVRINSSVGGDTVLAGDRIIIGPDARIAGDLTHRAGTIEIDPAAVIEGETIALEPRASDAAERMAVRVVASIVLFGIAFLIGVVILITLLAALLPALMRRSAQRMSDSPLAVLGAGFIIAFAAPAVMTLLAVTIIGIPIAAALGVVFAAAGMLAIAATAYFLGRKASGLSKRGETPAEPKFAARLGWTAVAMVALLVVGMIPILGGLVWLAAFVFGLGAAALEGARLLALGGASSETA